MPDRANHSLSVVIADDEQLARDELRFLLEEIGDIEILGTAANGLEAVDLIRKLDPAVAFLDIQMPGLDGLSVVRRLRESQAELPHIVFSTAWDQFAVEAFRLEAMDYVLKPVERERLAETIERARRATAEKLDPALAETARPAGFSRLLVRAGTRNMIVDPQDLIYATIDSGVITLVTSQVEGQSSFRTLEELQAALDPGVFWRARRSGVVNMNRIREVVPWFNSSFQLRMDDKKQTEIPVSRVQTKRLRTLFRL